MEVIYNNSVKIEKPKLISQGAFGCAYKPSLYCSDTNKLKQIDPKTLIPKYYKNKVSKILLKEEADKELDEYKEMQLVDKKNRFHLGKPDVCEPLNDNINFDQYAKCDVLNEIEIEHKNFLSKYIPFMRNKETTRNFITKRTSLLIMKNGGDTLDDYTTFLVKNEDNISKEELTKKIHLFWLEAYRMLYGIKLMIENDIIHYDIKENNILFDVSTNRMNIIDFGMSKKISVFKKGLEENTIDPFNWCYYPWETKYTQRNVFEKLQKKVKHNMDDLLQKLFHPMNDIYEEALCYIFPKTVVKENEFLFIKLFTHFLITVKESDDPNLYENFCKKSLETFDLYGLGIAYTICFYKIRDYLTESESQDMLLMLMTMITPNVFERTSINKIIVDFEFFLQNIIG